MEGCQLCEEAWEAAKEMTEGERKRRRKQLCITLPCELVDEISEISDALGLDVSRCVELCVKHGSKGLSVLKEAAEKIKLLEEGGELGESEGVREEEEGGEE